MPIYDYVCSRCGHRMEVVHGIHGHGPKSCPSCGAEGTMAKVFVPPAIHFKGSGWAKKDRAATASPGTSKSSKASPGSAKSTNEGGSGEAKPSSPVKSSDSGAEAT